MNVDSHAHKVCNKPRVVCCKARVLQQPLFPCCLEVQPHPDPAVLQVKVLSPLLCWPFNAVPRSKVCTLTVVNLGGMSMAFHGKDVNKDVDVDKERGAVSAGITLVYCAIKMDADAGECDV